MIIKNQQWSVGRRNRLIDLIQQKLVMQLVKAGVYIRQGRLNRELWSGDHGER